MSIERTLPFSADYGWPIRVALYQQIAIAFLCLLILDGGRLAMLCGIVMLGFWSGVALMLVRRPLNPTAEDKTIIRCGFVPLFAVTMVIAVVMQR